MNIHEYQAKVVLQEFGIPVPRGVPAFSVEEAEKAAREELKKKQKTVGNGGARTKVSEPKAEDKPASTPPPSPMLNLFDSPVEEEAEPRPITGKEVSHASQSDAS